MAPSRTPGASLVWMVMVLNLCSGASLACHPAEYRVNDECCPMCQPGSRVKTDCTELRSTSCLPCVEGTFTEKPNGLKRCLSCTSCDPASGLAVKKSCSLTSDTVCEPLEGFLCIDSTSNGCAATRKHRSCEPGQYIRQRGTAFTDTACSNCSDGTFSNGSSTTCQQHTKCEELHLLQTTAGTTSADAQCGEHRHTAVAVSGALVVLVFLLMVFIVGFLLWRKKHNFRRAKPGNPDGDLEQVQAAPPENVPLALTPEQKTEQR